MCLDILPGVEGGRCFDRVPVFSGEGVLGSLLETFLALGKALVPELSVSLCFGVKWSSLWYCLLSDSHDCDLVYQRSIDSLAADGSCCSRKELWSGD
jgi:hypothetical protein